MGGVVGDAVAKLVHVEDAEDASSDGLATLTPLGVEAYGAALFSAKRVLVRVGRPVAAVYASPLAVCVSPATRHGNYLTLCCGVFKSPLDFN